MCLQLALLRTHTNTPTATTLHSPILGLMAQTTSSKNVKRCIAVGVRRRPFCIKKPAWGNYNVFSHHILSGVQVPAISLGCIILANSLTQVLAKVIFWLCKPRKRQFNYTRSKGWRRVHLADWKQNSVKTYNAAWMSVLQKVHVYWWPDTLYLLHDQTKILFYNEDLAYFWFAEPVYSSKRKLGIQNNLSTRSWRVTVLRYFLVKTK